MHALKAARIHVKHKAHMDLTKITSCHYLLSVSQVVRKPNSHVDLIFKFSGPHLLRFEKPKGSEFLHHFADQLDSMWKPTRSVKCKRLPHGLACLNVRNNLTRICVWPRRYEVACMVGS